MVNGLSMDQVLRRSGIFHVAPKNVSQQAISRRSSPQEVVGGTIPDVQVLAGRQNWSGPAGAQAIRRRRRNQDDVQKRADGALKLVQMGDGAQVADRNQATLNALTDTRRRLAVPRAPLSQFVLESQPEVFSLDEGLFVQSLRLSRRGAAAGPSGMTADHLQPVLDTERDTSLFFQFATALAGPGSRCSSGRGQNGSHHCFEENGGIRGIVVGDILRRLVARTMAKQMAARVEAATAPFQYTLTTKAGCESVAHMLQSLTDQDERATIVSIDGVGAYDLISRTGCCGSCDTSAGPHQLTCGRMRPVRPI